MLERGRRGVAVTAAGEVLWRYARESLQLLDRMQAELGAFAEGVQGHVRVFGSKSAVAQFLPEDISRFANAIATSASAWKSGKSGKWCAASRKAGLISEFAGMPSTCAACARFPIIATISPSSYIPAIHLPARRSVSFDDTIDYEHVDIVARSIMQTTQRSAAAAAGKQMRYRIQVSTVDAAYRIVAANLAVAIVPREEASAIQQALGSR